MGSLEFAMKLQSTKAPYPGHLAPQLAGTPSINAHPIINFRV